MIEYIDYHDYTNTGVQIGKIAYDLRCMFEGKSTLGFLQLASPYLRDPLDTENSLGSILSDSTTGFFSLTDNATISMDETGIVSGNTKTLTNVDGPRAFEAFFESYLMTLGNKFVDSTSCIEYTNQTDVLMEVMKSMSERILAANGSVPMTSAMQNDLETVNNLIVKQMNSKCGVHVDDYVSAHMHTAQKAVNMLQINGTMGGFIQFTDGLGASLISSDAKADTTVQPKVYGSEVADTTVQPKVYGSDLPQPDLRIDAKVFAEQPPPVPLFNPAVQDTLIAIPSEYKAIIDG
jgi:hypothetical protein